MNTLEKRLSQVFKQLGQKQEKMQVAEPRLQDVKAAVFSTIDATALVADIIDLFTFKFFESQAALLDGLPPDTYGGNQTDKVFEYYKTKFQGKPISETDSLSESDDFKI